VRARAPRTLQILPHVMADLQTRPSANDNEYQSLDAQFSRAKWEQSLPLNQFLSPPFTLRQQSSENQNFSMTAEIEGGL
jgi:hypothetical protein